MILLVDEVGFGFLTKPASTWAPLGQTPLLRRISQRRVLSTIAALSLSGHLFKRHFDHAVKGEDVVIALRHFQRQMLRVGVTRLIVVWDRLSAHRSRVVQAYLNEHPEISIEWLPPYAPDLNPEEACHGNVKHYLRNATPETVEDIRRGVNRGFARLRRRPDLILGFFRHAGLAVNRLW